ncbi:MAG TPA: radical SAM protein [Candidatus Hydrogenedentes bacterium]|nr:radical SAM protein [Candidatus Hydrogenedentota bacterium]
MGHFRKNCITLFMTTQCNLQCSYCYLQDIHLPVQSIDFEFAKQGIRDFARQTDQLHIRFFGAGEPTLEFQKIVALTSFAKDFFGKNTKIEIQTNGVFTRQVATWLGENADIVWVSLDGPPSIQDCQRYTLGGKGTSEIIERNISIMMSTSEKITVGARATITPNNLYRQTEMLEYFYGLGIKAVFSDPVFPPVEFNKTNVARLPLESDFNLLYAKEFVKAHERAEELGIYYGSIFTVNFDEKVNVFCRACLPSPHLTTDGFVTCCDMSFLGSILPELIYGEYNPKTNSIEYDQNRIDKIRMRRVENLQECQGCEILSNCAGACFGEGVNETGKLLGVKKDYCEAIKFLAQHTKRNENLSPYLHP